MDVEREGMPLWTLDGGRGEGDVDSAGREMVRETWFHWTVVSGVEWANFCVGMLFWFWVLEMGSSSK